MTIARKLAAAVLGVAIATTAGCSSPAPARAPTADAAFLQYLRAHTNAWDNTPDAKVLALAKTVCAGWRAGMNRADMADTFAGTYLSVNAASSMIGYATATFCGRYNKRLVTTPR